ncbi:hypothetical protein Tco_0703227 [Tanacetum coccineum]|uniref:Uncharacterized protein n=1 Tax=Tanacetum coccineum TaxID=301880 RepID=A0ABQ4XZ33_9ASTR
MAEEKNIVVPTCYTNLFDSLKGWREKFFWVNASVDPIAMHWFSSKEFPQDSVVDGVDGDMVLETLLNDNSTQIMRYPEEFLVLIGLSRMWYAPATHLVFYDDDEEGRCLGSVAYICVYFVFVFHFYDFLWYSEMRLQDFIKVPNSFDVVCAEKKWAKNERPILEQTTDVVTPPSDHVVNLGPTPLNQVFPATALPPATNVGKRSPVQAPARESALKRGIACVWGGGGSSSGVVAVREIGSKADDALKIQLSDDLPSIIASKAGEFIPGISTISPKQLAVKGKKPAAPKKPLSKKGQLVICLPKSVMGESAVGSSHEAADDLCCYGI